MIKFIVECFQELKVPTQNARIDLDQAISYEVQTLEDVDSVTSTSSIDKITTTKITNDNTCLG